MTRPVLVTGAQGFIGRYVVRALLDAGWECVVGTGRSQPLRDVFTHDVIVHGLSRAAPVTAELDVMSDRRYQYRQADITSPSLPALIEEIAPETVVHLAATRRESSATDLIAGNVEGVRSLVSACRVRGRRVRRLVLASSGGVYGIPERLPLHESAPCAPVDSYAASKFAGEQLARRLCAAEGIELVVGRIFNVVGPGQDERHVCGRLASQLAAITSGAQLAVTVRGLSATRDFVDVRDVARALSCLADERHPADTYNIASGVETSIGSLWSRLCHHAHTGEVAVRDEGRSEGVARHVASVDKLDARGPWRRFNLDQSVADVLRYYLREIHRARTGDAAGGMAVR